MRRDPEKARAWRERSKPLERSAGLKQRSTKRAAELREYRKVTAPLRDSRCAFAGCTRVMEDVNHVKPLGRGGSFLDPSNHVPLCRAHHDWVTVHPAEAHALGLTLHSWE